MVSGWYELYDDATGGDIPSLVYNLGKSKSQITKICIYANLTFYYN